MTIADTFHLAFRNLGQSRLRTVLTLGGVAVGIASLAGMVSLGVGLQEQLVGRFVQSGLFNQITVMPGGLGQGGLGGGRGRGGLGARGRGFGARIVIPADATPSKELDDAAMTEIAAVQGIQEVYPVVRVPVQVAYGEVTDYTPAAGVPMSAKNEGAFQSLAFGTFFPNDTAETCMLSLDAAKALDATSPGALIGKSLTISYASAGAPAPTAAPDEASPLDALQMHRVTRPCTVVGIVERPTGPGIGPGGVADLMLPLARAREIESELVSGPQALMNPSPRKRTYSSLVVRTTTASATEDVETRLKRLGYTVFSVSDALQGAKRAFLVLDIVLGLIGSIALLVSSLGIMNTMIMSILERTREIGIMKAIGASDVDVRRIFLVEASTIGLLGGVGGVLLGWVAGRVINFGANVYIQNQGGTPGNLFSLPLWLISGAIAFSWAVSLLAGLYPATRAARLNPIDALRRD